MEKDGVFIPTEFDLVKNTFRQTYTSLTLNIFDVNRIDVLIRKYKLKNIFYD